MPGWRNWQTRCFEVAVGAIPCRFDSCPGHLKKTKKTGPQSRSSLFLTLPLAENQNLADITPLTTCPRGETGRRSRLKICRTFNSPYRFDSGRGHSNQYQHDKTRRQTGFYPCICNSASSIFTLDARLRTLDPRLQQVRMLAHHSVSVASGSGSASPNFCRSASAVASWSHRSFSGCPVCPRTHVG